MSLPPLKLQQPLSPQPEVRASLRDEAGGLRRLGVEQKVEIVSRTHCSSMSVCFPHTLAFQVVLDVFVSLADGHLRAYRLRTDMPVSLLDSNVAFPSFFKHA